MCMFSYATARESTPNIKVNRSKSRNVYMKIISATPKTIKIKIFNKSENIARYSESFTPCCYNHRVICVKAMR